MDARVVDPRVERTRRLVTLAALEELAAAGYGAFSIESVSARSGVAKSTIYRHWSGRLALVSEALETLNRQPAAGGSSAAVDPRARVVQLVHHLAEAFRDGIVSGCIPALVEAAEHHADVRTFLHGYSARRRRALTDAIAAGLASGDFRAGTDPETAAVAISGAVVYSRLMTDAPFDPERATSLVELVLGRPER